MEPGFGFRRHAWKRARADLLPTLPLQVVRIHMARARRLGLDYKAYASFRATAGRDIVAFLFSGNALRLAPAQSIIPPDIAHKVRNLPAGRIAGVYAPTLPDAVQDENPFLTRTGRAPGFTTSWADARDHVQRLMGDAPRKGILLVAATDVEREWCAMGRMGGMLSADRFFAAL